MKVTINEQPKRFYQHFKTDFDKYEWIAFVGHEIKVGEYTFFIAPLPRGILNVSEATTGSKVFEAKITDSIFMSTENKEETMEFYRKVVGEKLIEIIEKYPDIKERIKKMREENIKQAGEMPPIEDVDEILILEPISDVMN